MSANQNDAADDIFYAPLLQALESGSTARSCPEYPDFQHALCGTGRVLMNVRSGRDWLQQADCELGLEVSLSQFFDALKSPRRTASLAATAEKVARLAKLSTAPGGDALAEHPELGRFAVYATDGHLHDPSAHEDEILGNLLPRANIFSLSLRDHSLRHLELSSPRAGKKYENEITTLKRKGFAWEKPRASR
jgi:hypothetical protein